MFDRFASWASEHVASAWFFAACVLLVAAWLPSYLLFGSVDTWQLVINTATTIVTFLLVALLQNTQERDARAMQRKLDAVAVAVAELADAQQAHGQGRAHLPGALTAAVAELRSAAGESSR